MKLYRIKAIIFVLRLAFGVGSFALFWYGTNWMAAVGLYCVLLANNIGIMYARDLD